MSSKSTNNGNSLIEGLQKVRPGMVVKVMDAVISKPAS